jgi:predicted MPP superfamily phosphohydrolase
VCSSDLDLALVLAQESPLSSAEDDVTAYGRGLRRIRAHELVGDDEPRDGLVEDRSLHAPQRSEQRQRHPAHDDYEHDEEAETPNDLLPQGQIHRKSILDAMRIPHVAAAAAAGLAAYTLCEPYRYRLVTHRLLMRSACPDITILHVSDTHFGSRNRALAAWLERLPDRLESMPDLVLATGDFIETGEGVERAVEALAGLEARLGRFYVLGSHDYYESKWQPPTKYLGGRYQGLRAAPAPTEELESGLRSKGWLSLTNTSEVLRTEHGDIRLAGVDDPYLKRHVTRHIATAGEVLAVGLVHAPDVVSEWLLAGFDLVLAGHTHAGQVRVPRIGALVTNSSLPAALAGGLHRVGHGWLHVSPGLGTGRFSPVRFNCRPEATLLRLVPELR